MSKKPLPYKCKVCNKKLFKNLYVVLSNFDNTHFKRLCYGCQKDIYGMDFFVNASTYNSTHCLYCEKNVWSTDLLNRIKYYLFTDMSDAKKVVFCEECFTQNSPT